MIDFTEIASSAFSTDIPKINLPPELSKYINAEKLYQNSDNYPEMQRNLSPEQQRKIGLIKNTLLTLPLIHVTRESLPAGANIKPSNELQQDGKTNTYGLDRSLDLDKYTFFNWGLPQRSGYGTNIVLLSASILNDSDTIATPWDIGEIAYVDETPYEDLPQEKKDRYQKGYFDKMVTGKKWLEIIARRVLQSYEDGKPFYRLGGRGTLGEIKHLGQVHSDNITSQITKPDFPAYYKFLYEHGFAYGPMEDNRELFLRLGKRMGVDSSHEDCGIDYDEAALYWKNLLE